VRHTELRAPGGQREAVGSTSCMGTIPCLSPERVSLCRCTTGWLGSGPTTVSMSNVAANSPSSRWLAGAAPRPAGFPASTATQRFSPCSRRSTGPEPATWPPQGPWRCSCPPPAAPTSARVCGHRRPGPHGVAGQPRWRSSTIGAPAQGGRRAAGIGDAAIAAAEHQAWMSLSKRIRSGLWERWQPGGWVSSGGAAPRSGTQRGSRMDDGRAGTRPPDDRRA
jgi:hypothetical protein